MDKDTRLKSEQQSSTPVRKFDALWWIVLFGPILWWSVMLVLVIMQKVSWNIFISSGFVVQGCFYGLQAALRMLIRPLGRGYSRGHHTAFMLAGLFWAVLGLVLLFVTRGL